MKKNDTEPCWKGQQKLVSKQKSIIFVASLYIERMTFSPAKLLGHLNSTLEALDGWISHPVGSTGSGDENFHFPEAYWERSMFSPPSQLLETGRPPRGELSGMQQIVPGMFPPKRGVKRKGARWQCFAMWQGVGCFLLLLLGYVESYMDEQSTLLLIGWIFYIGRSHPRDVFFANVENPKLTQVELHGLVHKTHGM